MTTPWGLSKTILVSSSTVLGSSGYNPQGCAGERSRVRLPRPRARLKLEHSGARRKAAVQAAITVPNSLLNIDWSAIFGQGSPGHAIDYDPLPPLYSSAIMITKLIEFNDTDNSGNLNSEVPYRQFAMFCVLLFKRLNTWCSKQA